MTDAQPRVPRVGERISDKPVDMRVGDDRVTRTATGAVCHWFGWYSPEQETARKVWAREVTAGLCTTFGANHDNDQH